MSARLELERERFGLRHEMAQRLAAACMKGGVKTHPLPDDSVTPVFVVEDAAGTQYTVTVARRRQQDNG